MFWRAFLHQADGFVVVEVLLLLVVGVVLVLRLFVILLVIIFFLDGPFGSVVSFFIAPG